MLHVIEHICKVDLRLVAHVALHLRRLIGVGSIDECCASIEVIAAEAVDDSLDGLESSLVQYEITREDVHCQVRGERSVKQVQCSGIDTHGNELSSFSGGARCRARV